MAAPDYRRAGVDLAAADGFTARLQRLTGPGVAPGTLGPFAAATPLPAGYTNPVVVSACDGVGTKLALLAAADRLAVAGHDLVAMCTNDLACLGATPWLVLDYYGCDRLDPTQAMQVVEGITTACATLGCDLVGGETAELPGTFVPGGLDLAGCALGLAEAAALLGPHQVQAGDRLVGILTTGFHCNGYALVRQVVRERNPDLDTPCGPQALADALLAPTPLYTPVVQALLMQGLALRAAAHITGGGLAANVRRALPAGLAARFDHGAWPEPPLHRWLREAGNVENGEMAMVFNGGVGMVLVVGAGDVATAIAAIGAAGHQAQAIGTVVTAAGDG